MQPKQSTSHQSLEKALKILLSFTPDNQEVGTLELSEKSGLHKSTVSRLLHVLEAYGFVQQNPQSKKFTLGPSIIELGGAVNHSLRSHLVRCAAPYLDRLRNKVGETVLLEVRAVRSAIIGYVAEGAGPVHLKESVGYRHWYHAAAGAKAILAFSDPEFRERLLREKLVRCTRNTVTDPKILQSELERTRRRGFAFDDEERHIGVRAFGCPIFNSEKWPVAAVAVAGSSQNITWDKRSGFVPELKNTAEQLSKRLLYDVADS
jgi:IclR family transcriptional regulator, KDG regulon repressor